MRLLHVVALLPALAGCQGDVVRDRYATVDEARADDLFVRGWLPDILPPSSRDIVVANNLDLNISNGEFSFHGSDFGALEKRLTPFAARTSGSDTKTREVVADHVRQGYRVYSLDDESSSWLFFCRPKIGYCQYAMRLRRE